jgi:hypothetical protein
MPTVLSRVRFEANCPAIFFTDADPPAPQDATRNVLAGISVRRLSNSIDPPAAMQVSTGVFRCTDPNCFTDDTTFVDSSSLGTITPGESTLLVFVWDPDNDCFIFFRDAPPALIFSYAGVLMDVDPPSNDLSFVNKRLQVRANIKNRMTGPRASGFIKLSVVNLRVNQSAAPP